MAIKILITLEGSEQVKSAIDGIARRGEEMMSGFQRLGTGIQPLDNITNKFRDLVPAFESGTQVSHGFAESLRVVLPALRLAGVEVGNFAGFSRLASAGLTGLAAAITGAVVVALASLEESIKRTRGELEDLFGMKGGAEAFSELQGSAQKFGTTIANLQPGLESLKTAWDRFVTTTKGFKFVAPVGGAIPTGDITDTLEAYENFIKILRAGRQTQADAEKTAKTFFDTFKEGGKLTAQALDQLKPGSIVLLAEALGRGRISAEQFRKELTLQPLSIEKVLRDLKSFGPQSEEAFQQKAIKSYRDELNGLFADLSKSFEKIKGISFGDAVTGFLKEVRSNIKFITDDITKLIDLWRQFQAFAGKAPAAPPEQITPQLPTGTEEIKKTFRDVPEAWKRDALNPIKEDTKQTFNTIGIDIENAPFLKNIDPQVKEQQRAISEGWKKTIESVPPFKIEDIFNAEKLKQSGSDVATSWEQTWQKIFDFIKKGLSEALVSPAGAAEFTGGPLLQQQQQVEQTQPIVAPFQAADQQIRTIWQALVEYIKTSLNELDFSPLTQALIKPFTDALPGIRDALLQVERMIQELVRQALEAGRIIQQLNQGGTPRGGGGGFSFQEVAGGGLIRGPGTNTSDSILTWFPSAKTYAWTSDREFVHPAKAVQYYGLEFMEAIRNLKLPRNIFPRFNVGGLVLPNFKAAASRSLASGGSVATASATRSLTLVLDTRKFNVTGSKATIDELEREAVMRGISATGIAPGWVR